MNERARVSAFPRQGAHDRTLEPRGSHGRRDDRGEIHHAAPVGVALSWLFLFAFVVGGAFVGAWFSHGVAYDAGWLFGTFQRDLVSLIGFASLIAVVGLGYSEYRGAMAINVSKQSRVQL